MCLCACVCVCVCVCVCGGGACASLSVVFLIESFIIPCLTSLYFLMSKVLNLMLISFFYRKDPDLFVCLFGFLTSSSTTRLYRGRAPRQERLTILRAATHETELGDHDFCLSRSHYTDTDPTCRELAATAGIEPGTSSPGVPRSTAELPRPPKDPEELRKFFINTSP